MPDFVSATSAPEARVDGSVTAAVTRFQVHDSRCTVQVQGSDLVFVLEASHPAARAIQAVLIGAFIGGCKVEITYPLPDVLQGSDEATVLSVALVS